jgi:MFS family permease
MPDPSRTLTVAAPADVVRAEVDAALAAAGAADDIQVRVEPQDGGGTVLVMEPNVTPAIPYFGWFMTPLIAWRASRILDDIEARVRGIAEGRPPPAPRRSLPFAPPASFDETQAVLLATVAALFAVVELGASLFSQFVDFVGETFSASDRALGVAAAASRSGVLIALLASAAADRRGRRRLLLISVAGVCAGNLISAVAPTLAVFTIGQVLVRGFVNAAITIGLIAAVEGAPEGARAYSVAMLTLAGGFGYAIGVALLPLGDVAGPAWRVAFAISAASVVMVPGFARRLEETARYRALAARTSVERRGRWREVVDRSYGPRFVVLAIAGFLLNVFAAPSSQLSNRYLSRDRGFSGSGIALLTAVTTGVPGFVGLAIGGRLAESRGRRPVGAVALGLATLAAIAFYLATGSMLWLASAANGFLGGAAAPSLGAFNGELFPTEVRGTANGLLVVIALAGSAVGLLTAGSLSDHIGLGKAIALLGIAPLIGAFLIPLLPEPADKELDDVSPSEV